METTNNLQNKINERAEKKLNADLSKLCNMFHGELDTNVTIKLVDVFEINQLANLRLTLKGTEKDIQFRDAFWSTRDKGFKYLKEHYLPRYIEHETLLFLKEIEEMKKKVIVLEKELQNLQQNDV